MVKVFNKIVQGRKGDIELRIKLDLLNIQTKGYIFAHDKTKTDKLMYISNAMVIHKIIPYVIYNKWLKRWDTLLEILNN